MLIPTAAIDIVNTTIAFILYNEDALITFYNKTGAYPKFLAIV
jgi:hypothetical protein